MPPAVASKHTMTAGAGDRNAKSLEKPALYGQVAEIILIPDNFM